VTAAGVRRSPRRTFFGAAMLAAALVGTPAAAQSVTQRGFVELDGLLFPQDAANDGRNAVGDLLVREDVFLTATPWLQLAAGGELRANTHGQVRESWEIDFSDRGIRRPALAVRRVSATMHRGPLTLDVGKQFIRWGKTDIVTPTDRLAPRDYLDVIDSEFLAVRGVRATVAGATNVLDLVWVPYFTPSRMPLLDQRWTVLQPDVKDVRFSDKQPDLPARAQVGARLEHLADGYEFSISFFDGYSHLPDVTVVPLPSAGIGVIRTFPTIRMYGGDVAWPTPWFTVKAEAGYFTSRTRTSDEYVLYVVQLERQTGEWLLIGGYGGEVVTDRRSPFGFSPERGIARSLLGRASYTIGPTRSLAMEAAVRQDGGGFYAEGEYSEARGAHWRVTVSGSLIRGDQDDFLGQFRRNSRVAVALRYSF
jgi:hypothetical protein